MVLRAQQRPVSVGTLVKRSEQGTVCPANWQDLRSDSSAAGEPGPQGRLECHSSENSSGNTESIRDFVK